VQSVNRSGWNKRKLVTGGVHVTYLKINFGLRLGESQKFQPVQTFMMHKILASNSSLIFTPQKMFYYYCYAAAAVSILFKGISTPVCLCEFFL
jgi:hypothetical protein